MVCFVSLRGRSVSYQVCVSSRERKSHNEHGEQFHPSNEPGGGRETGSSGGCEITLKAESTVTIGDERESRPRCSSV